jgi:hypothetical protein
MKKSGENCIKIAMSVAKHTAEYVSNCSLEGILCARDFINGFYIYEYDFRLLEQFSFQYVSNFILRFRSLSGKLRMQRRDI